MEKALNIKAVCFDVDNTLFDHKKGQFTESSIKAIEQLKNNGIKIFACTSRSIDSLESLNFSKIIKPDAIASYNGAVITSKNQTYAPRLISTKTVQKSINLAKKHDICVQIITINSGFLITNKNESYYDFIHRLKEKDYSIKEYENEPVTGIVFYCKDSFDKDIKSLPGFFNRFDSEACEIIPQENFKSEGIVNLERMFNINRNEIMCFGDDVWDIPMFEVCGYSVAMGNAKKEVKMKADEITDNIENDGIYNSLKRHKLI